MNSILFPFFSRNNYGGQIYNKMTSKVLREDYKLDCKYYSIFGIDSDSSSLFRLLRDRDRYEIIVAPRQYACFCKSQNKNILIFHHLDFSVSNIKAKITAYLNYIFLRNNRKRIDYLVCVSEFWQNYLRKLGFSNVKVIYNSFDLSQFEISELAKTELLRKYDLRQRPIIYIGLADRANKGTYQVYEQLKDMDFELVATGKNKLDIPVKVLSLSYKEYLTLLTLCSTVVVMSSFKEGWSRVAHEAMLCKTPVVGSGSGGMQELLQGGRQFICQNIRDLGMYVQNAVDNQQQLGELGYKFASQFDLSYFKRAWKSLLEQVSQY